MEAINVGFSKEQFGFGTFNEPIVFGEKRRGESVLAIIGQRQCIVKGFKRHNGEHRSKNLPAKMTGSEREKVRLTF